MKQHPQTLYCSSSWRIRAAVPVLFLCSGVSGLIYEVAWARSLTIVLGNTVFAVSTVLTAFMVGLALGGIIGGRAADRVRNPLLLYAVLEATIGVSAYLLTQVLDQTCPVYLALHAWLHDCQVMLYGARYMFAFCLLAVPTTLMGMTLPVLSKFVTDRERSLGLNIGRLYAVNTLGAAVGCWGAGFVLIGTIGLKPTVSFAASLNIVVGLCAWYLGKLARRSKAEAETIPEAAAGGQRLPARHRALVAGAFAVSGFAALGYEVVWTRILVWYLGNSVYAFSMMLTTFLVGIALGSLCCSQLVDRSRRLTLGFGLIHVGIGIYVLFSIYVFARYAVSAAANPVTSPAWWGDPWRKLFKSAAVMLPPTFLMGAAFPVAGRLYIAGLGRLGRGLGTLYACNTIGAALGATAAGFLLMPRIGLQNSLVLLLLLNLCTGLALCCVERRIGRRLRRLVVGALAAVTGLGLLGMPADAFRRKHELSGEGALLYYNEDVIGTVTVRQVGSDLALLIDNLDVAGTSVGCVNSHKALGHFPMLLHPNPEIVYVLGFGGGGTTYAIGTYPTVKQIDATELSQSVLDVAPLFREINHDVMSDPRLHLEVTDGRYYLVTARRIYDVISVDLLWPQTAGAGSLYTREFYQLCHRSLRDDGLMAEWLHPDFIPPAYLGVILRTVGQVFQHTYLWWSRQQEHLLLVATKRPLQIDFEDLSRRMQHPPTHADLQEWGLTDAADFATHFITAGDVLAEAGGGPSLINTDDLPVIEFKLPLCGWGARLPNHETLAEMRQSVLPLLTGVDAEQREQLLLYERSNARLQRAFTAFFTERYGEAEALARQALAIQPGNREAMDLIELAQGHLASAGR